MSIRTAASHWASVCWDSEMPGPTLSRGVPADRERVARATDGENVDLSVLRGQRMWFVDQIESSYRLRAVSAVGLRFSGERNREWI